ncbi:MAG TPA: glycerol kinase GlpK [Povalibacter sp.]|uniref:glycerol kinase GlpK n=1 Tax=Povalibacter sp. TaxID=1962978 RepID=UPI002BA8469F|nr:glycerol kinase GlpK [Povalibacter sp.]HMN44162.1 glycerol kinase GlpK [Povalibacter sp.]
MKKFVGAIDQGTTSTRFIVFDEAGRIVASAQQEHAQIYPQPGWVEHSPQEILRNTDNVIAEALVSGKLTARDIACVGITNQRETTVLWDRASGEPLHNALVWQDTRVDPLVQYFSAQGGKDRFRARTGLPLASYFSGLKLRWLLDNVPGARTKAEAGDLCFGTIDAWLMQHLTHGTHITDVTNASRTQLMNLESLQWDDELLQTFRIPASVLPRIASSSEVYGEIAHGPLKGVPIAGILGDQQAALVGQTCFAPGEAKNTYGTGCFLLMNTGNRPVVSAAGLVTTVAYQFGTAPACYALEGSIAISGALVQWLRDNLGLIRSSNEIEALAASVADNGDVYVVPAFSGLYAPHWKEHARGVITGLTRYATKAHIARAALEATAYQTREVLAAMEQDSRIRLSELRVDGGMVVNELLMQFQADILDVAVVRPRVTETTALGAAYAAGLATGFWKDSDHLKRNWGVDRTWKPAMPKERRGQLYASWQKAVARSLNWID